MVVFLLWGYPKLRQFFESPKDSREHFVGVRFRSVISERHSDRDMARVTSIVATLEVWPSALSQSLFESTIRAIRGSGTAIRAEEA